MTEEIQPIVILGTGRCGSTFLQTSLSGASNIWIWGEHDGILRSLFTWSRQARNSNALQGFSFPYVHEDPFVTLKRDGTRAAWLSPFDAEAISEEERAVVTNLFTRRLPEGKTRWGFKEIRYGAGSHVPERMLELFPGTKFIHVVRHPRGTVSSSIRAWRPEIFDPDLDETDLSTKITELVAENMNRWKVTTAYLEDFSAANPGKAMTVKIEEAKDRLPEILEFLEADPQSSPVEVASETNPARNETHISDLINAAYEAKLAEDPDFASVAERVGYTA